MLQIRQAFHRSSLFRLCALAGIASLLIAGGANAQEQESYKARLAPLGVTGVTINTIKGLGTATASLKGNTLTVQGTFDGLVGTATDANLRRGPKGIPGPVISTLEFTRTSQGKFNGMLTLSAAQIEDLRAGRLYVQIHSEKAPDGSIRGWLLK